MTEEWSMRAATRDDDDALCAFLASIPMEGRVTLAQERAPDFFAALDAFGGPRATFVAEAGGRIVGCGSYALRDAWLPDGTRGRVGYICDLRVLPEWRGARVIPRLGRRGLEQAREAHGCDIFLSAVMESNARVVGTATSLRPARAEQPRSRAMTPYDMASLPPGGRGDARVERLDDMDEVARFLDAGQRTRMLGEPTTRKTLEGRFLSWPGLRPSSFLGVRDASGALVACAAPYDASPLRRYRALRYAVGLRTGARLVGLRLPPPGGLLHVRTLSHLEVRDDDPHTFAALLRAARAEAAGAHLVSAFVPRASPLERGLPRLTTRRAAMTLFVTTLHDSAWANHDLASTRPGFEMALA